MKSLFLHNKIASVAFVLLFLMGCTDEIKPRYAKPDPAYIPNIIITKPISYGGNDADLVVTENAVYLVDKELFGYLYPVYECRYENFSQEPVINNDLIGITCLEGSDTDVHYIHVPNSADRESVIATINKQLINHPARKQTDVISKQVIGDHAIGITTSNACIPSESSGEAGQNESVLMVLHPVSAGYAYTYSGQNVYDPATFGAGTIVTLTQIVVGHSQYRQLLSILPSDVGSSLEFSLVLASMADSILDSKVAFVSKPCNSVIEGDSDIGSVDSHLVLEEYNELNDEFAYIVEIDTFSGKLFDYENPKSKGADTQLSISCMYSIIDTKNGRVIDHRQIEYIHTNPVSFIRQPDLNNKSKAADSNIYGRGIWGDWVGGGREKITDVVLEDIYLEIAGLIVDDLKRLVQIQE